MRVRLRSGPPRSHVFLVSKAYQSSEWVHLVSENEWHCDTLRVHAGPSLAKLHSTPSAKSVGPFLESFMCLSDYTTSHPYPPIARMSCSLPSLWRPASGEPWSQPDRCEERVFWHRRPHAKIPEVIDLFCDLHTLAPAKLTLMSMYSMSVDEVMMVPQYQLSLQLEDYGDEIDACGRLQSLLKWWGFRAHPSIEVLVAPREKVVAMMTIEFPSKLCH